MTNHYIRIDNKNKFNNKLESINGNEGPTTDHIFTCSINSKRFDYTAVN